MRKKLVPEEKALSNAVAVYRQRGHYLQRLEQFEKAIQAYNEALRWNGSDVRSLLGRSLARAKATHYAGALEDARKASELEPENLSALQIRAETDYEKCDFERALVLAHRGQRMRRLPPNFADCAKTAEETVRECAGNTAEKMLSSVALFFRQVELKRQSMDAYAPLIHVRKSRMQRQPTHQVQEISRAERQKAEQISRLMASKYLERMAHDKYFLTALSKDERLASANKQGARELQELANKALADVENRQAVLRERRPLYAARASEAEARARLSRARKEQLTRAQRQHIVDARRLVRAAQVAHENRDMAKCLENAEFAMEQISRKPNNLLPGKEKFLHQLYDIVANAFLDQKRVKSSMSESDREKRAFVLLGMYMSREPSRDSVLRARPPSPPRDAKSRLRTLERALASSARPPERCYLLHELARLHADTKQSHRARFLAFKCQSESRAANQQTWLINSSFLLARCHLLQNNRPEARAALIEAAALARSFDFEDVAEFMDTNNRPKERAPLIEAAALARSFDFEDDTWQINSSFLLARCHLLQNNRPEARAAFIEAAALARSFDFEEVAEFMDTCVNVSLEGEVGVSEAILDKREKAMVNLMQDDDMRSAAEHLFRRMSVIPASRRFSIMPVGRAEEDSTPPAAGRRKSIIPHAQQPAQGVRRRTHPLGFQEFDI